MFLTQHPSHPVSFSTPAQCHRRHPTAPSAVVVQPTCTPGLLAMSKAAHPTSRKAARSSPKTKHATATAVLAQQPPVAVPRSSLAKVAETSHPRGRRSQPENVPSQRRNTSTRRSPHSHRNPAPQAEALDSDPFFSSPTIPKLSNPSGNLAKRRASQSNATFPAPLFAQGRLGGAPKSAPTGLLTPSHFKVCDDSFDDEDSPLSPPSTPVKARRPIFDFATPGLNAFEDSPSFKAIKPRQKRRVSADVGGLIMGHWSGDEDSFSSSSSSTFSSPALSYASTAPTTPAKTSTPGTPSDEDVKYAMPKSHSSPVGGILPRPAF